MAFRFDSSQLSQATRSVALWVIMAGLMLVGFGLLTILLRDLFVFIVAGLFFIAGVVVISWGVRLFIAAVKLGRGPRTTNTQPYRENVSIHTGHDPL